MSDALTQVKLQAEQAKRQLAQSEIELAVARKEAAENRQIIVIAIGQRFVPELFSALASGTGSEENTAQIKAMSTPHIAALIANALSEKMTRLEAFKEGLTDEQRGRVIQHVLKTAPVDWLNEPQFVQAKKKIEAVERAKAQADERMRQAEERARTIESQQTAWNAERMRLLGENERLRNALSIQPTGTPAQSMVSTPVSEPGNATQVTVKPVAGKEEYTPERALETLLSVIATLGYCERPRLEIILARDYHVAEIPNHFLINQAFENAGKQGLIEVKVAPIEHGFGRAPHLVRLTNLGIERVRSQKIEPVPSELTRLLDSHGRQGDEHISLILITRRLFEERYIEPVERVDIFPEPILLDDGRRSEPDLVVTLRTGEQLLVECERDTKKNDKQRLDKWDKHCQVSHGNLCIVTPTGGALNAILQEIYDWQRNYQGDFHLRATSAQQVWMDAAPRFWVKDEHQEGALKPKNSK